MDYFPCSTCGEDFPTKRGRANHERKHKGTTKLSSERAKETKRLKYDKGEEFPCSVCGQVFLSGCGISNHVRVHTGQSKVVGGRISSTRITKGIGVGSQNPNYGTKERPWLEGDRHPLRRWHRDNPDFGKNQRGEANPIHKVRHLYSDSEYVDRITSGLIAHANQKRGASYEEVYGAEKAKSYRQKLRDASPSRLSKFSRRETAPERIVREILIELGSSFQTQVPIGFYTVDFLVGDLVIQADGDYWHANPLKYPEPSIGQLNRRRLDSSCDGLLRSRGYRVLRLWESDLNERPDVCLARIKEEVARGEI